MKREKDFFKEKIYSFIITADKLGFRKVAQVMDRLIANRSPIDHKRWDEQTRSPTAQTVLRSLEIKVNEDEELTEEAQRTLKNLPKIEENVKGIHKRDNELMALEETGGLKTFKNRITSRQPSDILWSIVKLSTDENILKAFFSRKTKLGIRDIKDWKDFKKSHIEPFLIVLREAFGRACTDIVWKLAAQGSRFYGCRVETLEPEDIYSRAYEFFSECGISQSMIFSISSGLPNPLERHGTQWYLNRYNINPDNEAVKDLLLKNPFRIVNFSRGILNNNLPCERIYVWEMERTRIALRKAYEAVPKEKKELFISDAIEKISECLSFPKLRILEIPSFETWMTRLTRNGPNTIMISFRGTTSKRISHGINIKFSRAEEIDQLYKIVFPIGTVISQTIYPNITLGILWAVAICMESKIYYDLQKKLFARGFDWRTIRIEGLNEIKPFGLIPKQKIKKTAETKIEEMLQS